jgi:hypothetical protein
LFTARTIGSTLQTADRALCQILNDPYPSTPLLAAVKLTLLLIAAETMIAHTHINTFWVEFWFQPKAIVLPQFHGLNIYFRTCFSALHVKIAFPAAFSLLSAVIPHCTAKLQLGLLVLLLKMF